MSQHGADVESRLRTTVLFAEPFIIIQMLLAQASEQAANPRRHLSTDNTPSVDAGESEVRPDAKGLA